MASIEKRVGKNGDSYRITVSAGYTKDGKKVKHTKTWTPDPSMSEKKIAKMVQRVAADFERDIELGYQTDNRQTFSEYAHLIEERKAEASDCIADVLLRGGERSQNASPTPKKQA